MPLPREQYMDFFDMEDNTLLVINENLKVDLGAPGKLGKGKHLFFWKVKQVECPTLERVQANVMMNEVRARARALVEGAGRAAPQKILLPWFLCSPWEAMSPTLCRCPPAHKRQPPPAVAPTWANVHASPPAPYPPSSSSPLAPQLAPPPPPACWRR